MDVLRKTYSPFFSKVAFSTLFIAIGCQTTDVVIGPVKLWEVMALFFLFFGKCDKKLFCVSSFFLLSLIFASLIVSYFSLDYFDYYSFLKSKYVIVLARGAELFLCFSIFFTVFKFSDYDSKITQKEIIFLFLKYNLYITFLVLFYYFISFYLGKDSIVSYSGGRLRGFFVEGGPYGLYCAFLASLSLYIRKIIFALVFAFALYLSQSKAGVAFFLSFSFVCFFFKVSALRGFLEANKIRFFFGAMLLLLFSSWVVFTFAYNYVALFFSIEDVLHNHINDTSFVYGRVAASHIGYNMFLHNPFFGVGLGDYSLVRNNFHYRQFFPDVSGWDLTGLGGIFNLLIENGVFGFLLFFSFWVYVFFFYGRRENKNNIILAYIFILPFAFGLQLYFPYPWFLIGLLKFK